PHVGQVLLRQLPEPLLNRGLPGPAFDAVVAGEHALDVAVEDREALAPGLGEDGAGGAAADAGQGEQGVEVARKLSVVQLRAGAGGGMEVARAGVVIEAGP